MHSFSPRILPLPLSGGSSVSASPPSSSKLGEKLLKSEAELVFLMFHRPNVAAGVSLHRDRERRRMRWRRYDPAPVAARWAVVGGEESSWSRWLVAPPTHAGGGEGYSNPTVIAALKLALLLGNLCHIFHVFWVYNTGVGGQTGLLRVPGN